MKRSIQTAMVFALGGSLVLGMTGAGLAGPGVAEADTSDTASAAATITQTIPDGTYTIFAKLSDPYGYGMVRIDGNTAKLTVKDGVATARFKLAGKSIDYLYLGTGEEAKAAGEGAWSKYQSVLETIAGTSLKKEYYYFDLTVPVTGTNKLSIPLTYHSTQSNNWFDRTLALSFAPAKVTGVKVNSSAKKKAKVTWSKVTTDAVGYQVRYSLKKGMGSAKTVTVKGKKKTSTTVKKLKRGKKYYFQVRARNSVKTTKGTVIKAGAWSAKKSVKVK